MSHQPKSTNSNSKSIRQSSNAAIIMKSTNSPVPFTYFEKLCSEGINTSENNSLYTFGSNEMGQLGQELDFNSSFSSTPVQIPSFANQFIVSISAGDGHTVCVTKEGTVYAWGASACGQLGLDDNDSMPRDSEGYPFQPVPKSIKLIRDYKIKEVACGDAHTLALTSEGKVFSWGGAGCGQLGHPNINEMPKDADNCPYQPFPKIIEAFKLQTMIQIACGKAHSLSIDASGSIFTWGAGACGQLGVEDIHSLPVDEDGYPYQPVPKYLKSLKGQNVMLGVCGDVHTLILNDKGELYTFGGGSFGQLGLGPICKMPLDSDRYPFMPVPKKIESFGDSKIITIACGDSHSMAVDADGKLYAWGAAACGQLGIDSLGSLYKDAEGNPYQPEPALVTFFENMKVSAVACGEIHTLVLVEGGVCYSFGGNACGQLGYSEIKENKFPPRSVPKSLQVKMNELLPFYSQKPRLITSLLGKNIIKLACGGVHNILMVENTKNLSMKLYSCLKTETFTDFEIIYDENSNGSIKCHKFILISRSNYFYNAIKSNDQSQIVLNVSINPVLLKTVIEYMYLDDISFINSICGSENELIKSQSGIDVLLEYLKISKTFELKSLQLEIENKLKGCLIPYHEALKVVNETEEFSEGDNPSQSQFKGIFFLPNGNCLLLLNEGLINSVLQNSIVINFSKCDLNPGITSTKYLCSPTIKSPNSSGKFLRSQTGVPKQKEQISCEIANPDKDETISITMTSNLTSIPKDLNKTCMNFSAKHLFDQLIKDEESFDLIETLNKFNLIESDMQRNSIPPLGLELLKYFNKKETSDIIIKVGSQTFYSHKIILTSTSQFFEIMLSENMKENNCNEVVISDYSPEDFLYFLLFLYSDCLIFDLDRALDLLKGADMFAVDVLKIKLENFILSKLMIDNAAKIFKYASFYNYDRLKKVCLYFINDNYKQVIETQEFEDLHRDCMLEIIRFCKTK